MKKPSKPRRIRLSGHPPAEQDQAHGHPLDDIFHPQPELQAQLRAAPPELRRYVLALHAVIADLEVKKVTPQPESAAHGKRAQKRGVHNVDMDGLRKMIWGERPAEDSET